MDILKRLISGFGSKHTSFDRHILPWVAAGAVENYGIRRLNWEAVNQEVKKHQSRLATTQNTDQQDNEFWNNVAFSWLSMIQSDLGENYVIRESSNFMLLSPEQEPFNKALLSYLESSRRRLLHYLMKGIAKDQGYGKFVVMIFEDNDRYYDYVSHYGPQEGTFGMSAGMFIQDGYGHLVFPHREISMTELVAGHEMAHALVSHLDIPLWLNEGLAVNMEGALKGVNSSPITHHSFDKHQKFWSEENIQEFWTGESFARPDEGQELSYQLARILVDNLSEDSVAFVRFCNQAHWRDSGEKAVVENYGVSLQTLMENFLGDGAWRPKLVKA